MGYCCTSAPSGSSVVHPRWLWRAAARHGDVALGNVIGSNIANVGLILGIAALIKPPFPFIQDGTREGVALHTAQHDWYKSELTRRRLDFVRARGTLKQRVAQIVGRLHKQVP
jgi:hypothetical protein